MAKLFSDKIQLSILTAFYKDFKSICKDTGVKVKEVAKAEMFTAFEFKRDDKEKALFNIKLAYETYYIEKNIIKKRPKT